MRRAIAFGLLLTACGCDQSGVTKTASAPAALISEANVLLLEYEKAIARSGGQDLERLIETLERLGPNALKIKIEFDNRVGIWGGPMKLSGMRVKDAGAVMTVPGRPLTYQRMMYTPFVMDSTAKLMPAYEFTKRGREGGVRYRIVIFMPTS